MNSDITYENDKRSIIVLGSGAYRIGSSVEFDWCGVQALNTIRKEGYRSVMINYNPRRPCQPMTTTCATVSTSMSFTFERVMDIIDLPRQPNGVIVFTGGQIPNNLAVLLDEQGTVPILGTKAQDIDNAEDRAKFSQMLHQARHQPARVERTYKHGDTIRLIVACGLTSTCPPSYVLSGAAMNVCSNEDELKRFLQLAANVSEDHPVVGAAVYRARQGN